MKRLCCFWFMMMLGLPGIAELKELEPEVASTYSSETLEAYEAVRTHFNNYPIQREALQTEHTERKEKLASRLKTLLAEAGDWETLCQSEKAEESKQIVRDLKQNTKQRKEQARKLHQAYRVKMDQLQTELRRLSKLDAEQSGGE